MKVLLPVTLVVVLLACTESTSEENVVDPPVPIPRLAVSVDGAITLDGVELTIEALRADLAEASAAGAVVWYYREEGPGKPPEEAMQVMAAIIDNRLPVSLSSKPDFSTVVLPDGSVKTR